MPQFRRVRRRLRLSKHLRFRITTNSGVIGFSSGTGVIVISQNGNTLRVSADNRTFDVSTEDVKRYRQLRYVLGAGSATWNLNPASSDWNTASNWTPNTVLKDLTTSPL